MGILRTLFIMMASTALCYGAKIGDIVEVNVWDQVLRFVSLRDPAIVLTLVGSLLLGTNCGLMGGFLVVRRRSLYGDALSHAVLPGLCCGFLVTLSKDPWVLFVGALIAGLLGAWMIEAIRKTTVIKEDASMGLVLSGFYGVGVVLLTMIQNIPIAQQAGLDKYLFGQITALTWEDVQFMGGITIVSLVLTICFYKQFLVMAFDSAFLGKSARIYNAIITILTTFTIVISIKAVGVILVSAMLIIPAATALLVTTRMHRVLVIAVIIGMACGVLGSFISFLGHQLPTGPFMVMSATVVFAVVFLLNPRKGVIWEWLRAREDSVH